MGEGTNDMRGGGEDPSQERSREPSDEAERLERRADMLRDDLDGVVAELDHRRHALVRRLEPIALIAVGVVAVIGVGLALWRRHARHARPKLAPFADALRRMRAHPDRIARESPSMVKKVGAAALTTLASVAIRRAFAAAVPERAKSADRP